MMRVRNYLIASRWHLADPLGECQQHSSRARAGVVSGSDKGEHDLSQPRGCSNHVIASRKQ